MTLLDKRAHIAEEEGQQQRSDMRAVDIGIRHDNYLVVAKLCYIKLVAYSGAEGDDNRHELLVADNPVESRLFDVEHLAPKGKNRLEASVASLFCGAACGISLDDVELCALGVALGAVGKLAGQGV